MVKPLRNGGRGNGRTGERGNGKLVFGNRLSIYLQFLTPALWFPVPGFPVPLFSRSPVPWPKACLVSR